MPPRKKTAITTASGIVEYLPGDINYAFVQLDPTPTIGIIINQHEREIDINPEKGGRVETQFDICNQCNYFEAEKSVKDKLTALKVAPGLLRKEAIQHYRNENKCPGVLTKDALGFTDCKANLDLESIRKIKVKVPMTMWVKTFGSGGGYKIYAVKDLEKGLFTKPFLYANVHNDARICWGGNKAPQDFLTAYGLYWNAPFNRDLVPNMVHSLQYTLQNFDPEKLTYLGSESYEWQNQTHNLLGNTFCYTDRPSKAIIVFKNVKVLEGVDNRYLYYVNGTPQAVGWAKKNPKKDEWFITIYPTSKKLSSEEKIKHALIIKKKTLDPAKGKIEIVGVANDLFIT
jgi:hypothetical protein